MKKIFLVFFSTGCLVLIGCADRGGHNPAGGGAFVPNTGQSQQHSGGANSSAGGVTYADVKPLFQKNCSACHNSQSAIPNWLDYKVAFAKIDRIRDRVLVKKDMPLGGKLSSDELALIEKWIDNGAPDGSSQEEPTPVPAPVPPPVSLSPAEIFANNCASCHGVDSGALPSPNILGLDSAYVGKQLHAFASKQRLDLIMGGAMGGITQGMSEDDITKIAKFVSAADSCEVTGVAIDPLEGKIEPGKGILDSHACASCHAEGNQIGAPIIAAQKTAYLVAQLNAFKSGERKSDFMSGIAQGLTDQEIKDVSAYLNSLRKCPN